MVAKGSAPQSPSPTQTAAAQTGSNVSTAIANQQLNAIDQSGPWGSVKYGQNGTYDFTDPSTGQSYTLPKISQTTTLSPTQQGIFDAGQRTQQNLANTAESQSQRLDSLLSQPFSLSNDATEARLLELGSKRLDPQLAQAREREIARLSNQGIKLGSDAYKSAMNIFDQRENDARNQLLLTGRSQAVNEALLERNQPINEIIGLASGTQVQQPQFGGTPQVGMAGTDVAGITQADYANRYNAWQQQNAQSQSLMGGLFGLGANALMAFSDERLKTDIKETGEDIDGVPVKTWKWKGTNDNGIGVVAQELEKKHPELVDNSHPSGFKRVNYGGLMRLGSTASGRAA